MGAPTRDRLTLERVARPPVAGLILSSVAQAHLGEPANDSRGTRLGGLSAPVGRVSTVSCVTAYDASGAGASEGVRGFVLG